MDTVAGGDRRVGWYPRTPVFAEEWRDRSHKSDFGPSVTSHDSPTYTFITYLPLCSPTFLFTYLSIYLLTIEVSPKGM